VRQWPIVMCVRVPWGDHVLDCFRAGAVINPVNTRWTAIRRAAAAATTATCKK
tara:strand:+ start:134 stop:292 length:159 start_codon:yes stop_codon:yes gene_type:complete